MFASLTFWLRLRKHISWIMLARRWVDSLRDITSSVPRSGTYRHSAAPIAFWNSRWTPSILALFSRELWKRKEKKNVNLKDGDSLVRGKTTHYSRMSSGTSISNRKKVFSLIGGLVFFTRSRSADTISV